MKQQVLHHRAKAPATVANQPGFDCGGFAVKSLKTLHGNSSTWETLFDEVHLETRITSSDEGVFEYSISVENEVPERMDSPSLPELPLDPQQHTATRVLIKALEYFKEDLQKIGVTKIECKVTVKKGLSVRGTGLGSSGASPAAALRSLFKLLEQLTVSVDVDPIQISEWLKWADFDVPDNAVPSFFGGMTVIYSQNDQLSKIEQLITPSSLKFLLITPSGFGIETSHARKVLEGIQSPENIHDVTGSAINYLKKENINGYVQELLKAHKWFVGVAINEEGTREKRSSLYPEQGRFYSCLEQKALQAGALGLTISGAGPTMICFLQQEEDAQRVTQKLIEGLKEHQQEALIRLCTVDQQGAQIL